MVTLSTVLEGSLEGNYQLPRPAISPSRVAGVQYLGWDTPYSSVSLGVFRENRRRQKPLVRLRCPYKGQKGTRYRNPTQNRMKAIGSGIFSGGIVRATLDD